MSQKWKYQPPTYKQIEEAERLSAELDINPILCSLLIKRGVKSVADAKQFFRPKLSNLHNPFLMNEVGGQAVLGRQEKNTTPWLTERHGYDPTWCLICCRRQTILPSKTVQSA